MYIDLVDEAELVQSLSRGKVLVLGNSRTAGRVAELAHEPGYVCTDRVHTRLAFLVADEDVLDGFYTRGTDSAAGAGIGVSRAGSST